MLKIANFWRKIAGFYQVSNWNENSQYILYLVFILALFTAFFYHFLFLRYLISSLTVKHSASISKFEWFEQPCVVTVKYLFNGRCRITINHFLVLVLARLLFAFAVQLQCCVFISDVLQSKFTLQIHTKFKLKFATVS